MKVFLSLILVCLSVCYGFAEESQKIYFSIDQIVMTEEGPFVILNNEAIPVPYIAYDANGYYCGKYSWTCPECQTLNEWWRIKCKNCGHCRVCGG